MASRLEPASIVVLVTIASLVIDRVTNAVLLLLSYLKNFPDPESLENADNRRAAQRTVRVFSWLVAAALSTIAVAAFGSIRILAALGVEAGWFVDAALTVLTLTGGADFVKSLLSLRAPEAAQPDPKPMEVTGKLILEESQGRSRGQAA